MVAIADAVRWTAADQPLFADDPPDRFPAAAPLILPRVAELVRDVARAEILPRFRGVRADRKPDGSLVTEADVAAQMALERGLQSIVPCPVVGEEMLESEQRRLWQAGGWCWCIDPLDGTGNFVNGKPYFGVSVALTHDRVTQLAVILDPSANELFAAVRGQTATLNGTPLTLGDVSRTLRNARAEAGLYKKLGRLKHALIAEAPFAQLSMSGASVLQWCHLAAGRYDVFVHPGENPWDYAAGALILESAGGKLCTFTHDDYWADPAWHRSAIAATNAALFAPWRDWVRRQLEVDATEAALSHTQVA
ncbi:MAG: inositol monophosphatase family protein [Betaproteobacteria bacterium]|nr:inositol monophosphatase family protein [Betaproteobacteria bacterium]